MFTHKKTATAVTAALLGLCIPLMSHAGALSFEEVKVPETDNERRQAIASPKATVDGVEYRIGYNILLRSGETLVRNQDTVWSDNVFGGIIDYNGAYIRQVDGSIRNSRDSGMDHNSLIEAHGKLWLTSQFESRPGAVYVTELKKDADGHLYPRQTRPVDFSAVNGGWVHCAGSNTPWNTHLGSEEYEPDGRQWTDPDLPISDYNAAMVEYFTNDKDENYAPTAENAQAHMNPYDYGYAWEVEILNGDGETAVKKHYAMGRMAMELAYVMPDEKTVYLTDDGTNVGLFMFVADAPRDLAKGTLYAGKWTQSSDQNGGEAQISWVNLGTAEKDNIGRALDAGVTFDRMFESVQPIGASCPDGFTSINSGHGSPYHECVKLTEYGEANKDVVSRLETRRYAAYLGATTEWRKMEGITYDSDRGRLYLAMSEINSGMLDGNVNDPESTYDVGGNNDIRLPENFCGAVYALDVGSGQSDSGGSAITSDYVATNMKGQIVGTPVAEAENSDPESDYYIDPENPSKNGKYAANVCHVGAIANPDNVTYIANYGTLIIGEDAVQGHQNDMMWAYQVEGNQLTRMFTTPYGSESTSPYWYSNIGGHGYLLGVIQHPYGENDGSPAGVPQPQDRYTIGSLADRDWTGYIGPFPPMD